MHNQKKIQAFILAGGKSSRMGTDKGFAVLEGKTFISRISAVVSQQFPDLIIITNNNNYDNLGFRVMGDIIPEQGPIGGIYTGLINSDSEINLFVSCDIPLITPELISFLVSKYKNQNALVVKHQNGIEPLCGIYSKNISSTLLQLIEEKKLSMHNALNKISADTIDITNEDFYSKNILKNINSPDELKKAEEDLQCVK